MTWRHRTAAVLAALGTLILASGLVVLSAPTATAADPEIVTWSGSGSENLPCDSGLLWVFTGTSEAPPVLTVDGTSYSGEPQGNGYLFATPGAGVSVNSSAYVTYYGGQYTKPKLVISKCEEDGPSSSPSGPYSSAPTSSAPTSSAPTSSAPTSSAPTSSAPTSSAPTSSAPTVSPSESLSTSSAPTSSAPTSATTSATVAPSESLSTSSTDTTEAPTVGGSSAAGVPTAVDAGLSGSPAGSGASTLGQLMVAGGLALLMAGGFFGFAGRKPGAHEA